MKNEIAKFTLRLPPRLKRKLEKAAQRAGVSQSKYLCTLIDGKIPEPGPPASFWKLMQELYDLHDLLLYQKEPKFTEHAHALELLIVQLQSDFAAPKEME